MIILDKDFQLVRYGLEVRLVNEFDASFIYRLRTDPKLSRFVHAVNGTVEGQVEWIRQYKQREQKGVDYYFIFIYEGRPVGVNRIYNITETSFTFGSWMFIDGIPFFCSMAGAVIAREIAFELLDKDIEMEISGTHEKNKKVLYFSRSLGMVFDGENVMENGTFLTGYLKREVFENKKSDIIRFFPV